MMIAVDTNILVHAHRVESIDHSIARSALTQLVNSDDAWAIAWPSVHEFISVCTNGRIFKDPTPIIQALAQIETLVSAGAQLLHESRNHIRTLGVIAVPAGSAGGQIHDARIAAICLDHGVSELWTADRDFEKFPQLRIRNPLL